MLRTQSNDLRQFRVINGLKDSIPVARPALAGVELDIAESSAV